MKKKTNLIIRGGSWFRYTRRCRSARYDRDNSIGFRLIAKKEKKHGATKR